MKNTQGQPFYGPPLIDGIQGGAEYNHFANKKNEWFKACELEEQQQIAENLRLSSDIIGPLQLDGLPTDISNYHPKVFYHSMNTLAQQHSISEGVEIKSCMDLGGTATPDSCKPKGIERTAHEY